MSIHIYFNVFLLMLDKFSVFLLNKFDNFAADIDDNVSLVVTLGLYQRKSHNYSCYYFLVLPDTTMRH